MAEEKLTQSKIAILGDSQVGKTAILIRFNKGTFSSTTQPTIGAGALTITMNTQNGPLKVQIWDTAGQERFRSLIPLYSKGSVLGIFVYSISSDESFQHLSDWINVFRETADNCMEGIIVGNKSDLTLEREVDFEKGQNFAFSRNMGFFETSAKNGENIIELFNEVGRRLSQIESHPNTSSANLETQSKKSCC